MSSRLNGSTLTSIAAIIGMVFVAILFAFGQVEIKVAIAIIVGIAGLGGYQIRRTSRNPPRTGEN